jgi:hypothetical protein
LVRLKIGLKIGDFVLFFHVTRALWALNIIAFGLNPFALRFVMIKNTTFLTGLILLALWLPALASPFHVEPYLQNVSQTGIVIMWETDNSLECHVNYGISDKYEATEYPSVLLGTNIYETTLSALEPGTEYHYQVVCPGESTPDYTFRTIPAEPETFRFIVDGDNRTDTAMHGAVVQAAKDYVTERYGEDASKALAFLFNVGDIVTDGSQYDQYKSEFFDPLKSLSAYVPTYVSIGNHEGNSPWYFKYLNLPGNEHWYSFTYGNAHFIGLDTNAISSNLRQVEWLKDDLAAAKSNPAIDFIFVFHHHPCRTELWPDGEAQYVCTPLLPIYEENEVTAYFYGHTHGYERGQSKNAPLSWILAGGGGSGLDYWGAYDNQTDYEELTISHDEYNFVLVEVTPGDQPRVDFTTISLGDAETRKYSEELDRFSIRKYNRPPLKPEIIAPAEGERVVADVVIAQASAFADLDEEDAPVAAQWQVSDKAGDYDRPLFDLYETDHDIYFDQDIQSGIDFAVEALMSLQSGVTYFIRMRYRDSSLAWSEWSTERSFVYSSHCGNNVVDDESEVCDGDDLNGQTCQALGYDSGRLSCKEDCSGYNEEGCRNLGCGMLPLH